MTAWSPPLPGPPCYPRSLPGSPATPPAVSYLLSCFRSLCDCSLSLKDSSLKSLLEPYTCLQLPPHSRFRSQARPRAAPSSQSRPAPSCQPPPHSPSDRPYGQSGLLAPSSLPKTLQGLPPPAGGNPPSLPSHTPGPSTLTHPHFLPRPELSHLWISACVGPSARNSPPRVSLESSGVASSRKPPQPSQSG